MANFGNIKTGVDLAEAALEVANKYKTLYITGCFGWPMTQSNKTRIKNEWEANRKPPRSTNIDNASSDTFGFDCVNLLKALLWGWNGDKNAPYGGVKYASNGVPDVDEGTMFSYCTNKSSDFNNIEIGEACWMQGHIGVYVGNGLCVECTPAWSNNVQITSCNRTIAGYNRRDWTKHGKLPYITYSGKNDEIIKPNSTTSKRELHLGDKGEDVKQLQKDLIELGYDLGTWGADGDFGNATDKAVRAFQKKNGLDVDGWVGKNTYTAIEKALAEKNRVDLKAEASKVNTASIDQKKMWDYFLKSGMNEYGVAGVMGNLNAESTLRPANLEDIYQKTLGMTDAEYTAAVDTGVYTNFIKDSAGYGLAQWTYWTLKRDMLAYHQKKGKSIGDGDTQMEFLVYQLSNQYPEVWKILTTAKSVREASDAMLLKFERPADQSEAVQKQRAGFGEQYYNKFHANIPTPTPEIKPEQDRKFKVGDEVKLKSGAKYTSGKVPQSWVYNSKLYVRELQANNTVVVSTLTAGAITGIVYEKDLEFYNIPEKTVNYLVTVTANLLNVRMAPSTDSAVQVQIKKGGYYTVVKEKGEWLQFKSGGWVMAKHVKRV